MNQEQVSLGGGAFERFSLPLATQPAWELENSFSNSFSSVGFATPEFPQRLPFSKGGFVFQKPSPTE
jgi:hypothetical protein